MSIFFNLLSRTNIRTLIQPQLTSKFFHSLTKTIPTTQILAPVDCNLVQSAGFKVKGKLRKRCKDCYFVRREQRLFVICNTHRRHKQMQMVKDEKNTWMLSHATQGKIRPW